MVHYALKKDSCNIAQYQNQEVWICLMLYYCSTTQWYKIGNLNNPGIIRDLIPDLKNGTLGFDLVQ